MRILAFESSCDDTACALVENGRTILRSLVASQIDEHLLYGGVVPEIASRMHIECISALYTQTMEGCSIDEVDAVAVTTSPGLIGSLLVGVSFAKALAFGANKPLIPVHHIRGHIAAAYLAYPDLAPPFLALVISGGHTHLIAVKDYTNFEVLGRTRDDAVGEAYDKAARSLGFPYPGGIYLDQAAATGDPTAFSLPIPKVDGAPLDFSFSGLKTAVLNTLHNAAQKGFSISVPDMAASFQSTVCRILTETTKTALLQTGYKKLVIAGGVSANSGIRAAFSELCPSLNCALYLPPLDLCGDNAAMIGAQAYYEFLAGHTADSSLNAKAICSVDYTIL